MAITVVSWFASLIVLIAFFPQTYKTVKTKDVSGISLSPWVIDFVGCVFWCVYGGMINSDGISVIVCNAGIALLIIPIMFYVCKVKFKTVGAMLALISSSIIWVALTVISILGVSNVLDLATNKDAKLVVGIIAGACTGFAFMPQAIRTIKTRITTGLSLWLLLLLNIGNGFWVTFWILILAESPSDYTSWVPGIIFTNFSILFGFALIWTKWRNIVKLKEKF